MSKSSRAESAKRGPAHGRLPSVSTRIVKRNGRLEQFNRNKLARSITRAGATKAEASLVTSRVATRLATRKTIPSRELSSMTARSLSRVNTTASSQYASYRDQKYRATKQPAQLIKSATPRAPMVRQPIFTRKIEESVDKIADRIATDSTFRMNFIKNPKSVFEREGLKIRSPETLREVTKALQTFDAAIERGKQIAIREFNYDIIKDPEGIGERIATDSTFRMNFIKNPKSVFEREGLKIRSPETLREVTKALQTFDAATKNLRQLAIMEFSYDPASKGGGGKKYA